MIDFDTPTTRIFGRMVLEEWRLQAELFGRRFALFPLVILAFGVGGVTLLALAGTDLAAIAAGLHALVFFFGLQTGTTGLIGRDAMRNVLGDVTMLVFTARTLPVTWRRLLAIFLVKDLCYYSALFLAPLVVGYGAVALVEGAGLAAVALLWATTTATFGLGAAASLTLAGLGTRSRWLVLAAVGGATGALLWDGIDLVAFTPYAIYQSPTPSTVLAGLAPLVVLGALGPLLFEPVESVGTRSAASLYPRVRPWMGRNGAVATRTLLDVIRSSGSAWKVLFSMGILFGVAALLLREVGRATALSPSAGIAFGTLLGLGTFTTYSWVTLFDGAEEYMRYPLGMSRVFAGKRRAYLVLSLPAGFGYLLLSLVWISPLEAAVGAVVFPLVAVYVYGLSATIAGLTPNELLFDTPRFAAFGAAMAVVAVPLITASLTVEAAPAASRAVAVGVALAGAVAGLWLSRRAGPRWARRLRARG